MKTTIKKDRIKKVNDLLQTFSQNNFGRPARVAVFEGEPSRMTDYWIADGMPFCGIDIDPDTPRGPEIEISLGGMNGEHLSRRVENVAFLQLTVFPAGDSESLEVHDQSGKTTIIKFEDWPQRVSRGAADADRLNALVAP